MKIKKIITVTAATLVLTGAVIGGAAVASSRHGRAGRSTTDSDTVQQGDQTGPDTPDTTEAPSSDPSGETGTESGTEFETTSDSAGGHEDPAGNVDHQFQGEE